MKVDLIAPYGYCAGVISALNTAKKAKEEDPNGDIYLLGMLVHNEDTVEELTKMGLKAIDERKESLEEALYKITEGSTVIFSAHGHPLKYEEIARERHLKTIDATCVFVKENELGAIEDIKQGKHVIYLGSKGHLETIGFTSNVKGASFYDVKGRKLEIDNVPKGEASPVLYSQTTLSEDEIEEAIASLRPLFPNLTLGRLRCHATSLRQKKIKEIDGGVEAIVVLGSRSSNNSMKLFELAKNSGKDAYICLNLEEVKALPLGKYSHIALTSGTSIPREKVLSAKDYLDSI